MTTTHSHARIGELLPLMDPDDEIRDFFVTMIATVHMIDPATQSADVEVQSKWFWKDKELITKLKNCQESGVDIRISKSIAPLVNQTGPDVKTNVIERLKNGERVVGCLAVGDVRAFPVNPEKSSAML